jgi:hypothetical protein
VKVKKQLHTDEVQWIKGEASKELADRCPDRLVVFPSSPCTNIGCEYSIQQSGYMNCTFVAAETGGHTLEAIGEMMGITREGVRLIEIKALKKLRLALDEDRPDNEATSTRHQSAKASRRGDIVAIHKSHQQKNPRNFLPVIDDRKLGECSG